MVARALLAALAVLPSGRAAAPDAGPNYENLGTGTACRGSVDASEHCDEKKTPCRHRYDVLTSMTHDACNMVCEALAKTCTGYEYSTDRRCEIWEVPIMHAASVADYYCFNKTAAPGSADGMLYPTFELTMSNFNFGMLDGNDMVMKAVAAGVKSSVVAAFAATAEPSKVVAAAGDVKVNINVTAQKVMVGIVPQTFGRTPLVMYAVLRTGTDFNDNTTGVKATLISSLQTALGNVPNISAYLTEGSEAKVELDNRMLTTTEPTEPSMMTTAAPSEAGSTQMPDGSDNSTSMAPRSVSGAFERGPRALAAVASVLALALKLC